MGPVPHINTQGLPQGIKGIKKKKGDLPDMWIDKKRKIVGCLWQGTGRVNIIFTVGNGGIGGHVRSKHGLCINQLQLIYNENMGGIDRFDQHCSPCH